MHSDRTRRFTRVLQASTLVLGVVGACTVADKSDYKFEDEPATGGASMGGTAGAAGSSSGTTGNGGTTSDGGMAGESGTSGAGGTAGKGGTSGQGGASAGDAGDGGTSGTTGGTSGTTGGTSGTTGGTSGTSGTGGTAGSSTGKCGDGNVDNGESCDDHNTVTEPCPYFATTCPGCSDQCRAIRPPSCGDNQRNGVNPTSFTIEYLASSCMASSQTVPLFFNGIPIPGLLWGMSCACQPGSRQVTLTDQALLAAVRQQGNVLSLLSNGADEYLAWAIVTIVFDNGARITRTAFDAGMPGDAETRNPGPTGPCTIPLPPGFFAYGVSDGMPFGGFPVEQCDGDAGCYGCSRAQCISLTSTRTISIPDNDASGPVAVDKILVPQLGTIRDVDVTLSVVHPSVGDLGVQLTAVTNQQIMLVDRRGGAGDNFMGTVLDSSCTQPISTGNPPFAGCWAPDSSLDIYNGFPSSIGYWTLTLTDHVANGMTGILNSWTLRICGAP